MAKRGYRKDKDASVTYGHDSIYIYDMEMYKELKRILKEQGLTVSRLLWDMIDQLFIAVDHIHSKGNKLRYYKIKVNMEVKDEYRHTIIK